MTVAREIINDAFFKAGIAGDDDPIAPEMAARGLRELRSMFKEWSLPKLGIFRKAGMVVPLTTAAGYVLTPRPATILNVRLRRSVGAAETPMQSLTRDEYDNLPFKASTGLPNAYHYDRQAAGTLYVWPVLATAVAESLLVTYERAILLPVTAGDEVDLPPEWEPAAMYNLAMRLAESYPGGAPADLPARAYALLSDVQAADREGSVWFGNNDDSRYGWYGWP